MAKACLKILVEDGLQIHGNGPSGTQGGQTCLRIPSIFGNVAFDQRLNQGFFLRRDGLYLNKYFSHRFLLVADPSIKCGYHLMPVDEIVLECDNPQQKASISIHGYLRKE
jgi:hypothetical protein